MGGIVDFISESISVDLGGFPILSLQYDGRNSEMTRGKLEGFVYRAMKWQRDRGNHALTGHS
jgi:hypothetical protein